MPGSKESKPIRVLSFDVDGCLSNKQFLDSDKTQKSLVEANQALFDSLQAESDNYQSTIVFLGSNRQSALDDEKNSRVHQSGSSYPLISYVAEHLNSTLDPLLMADIYASLDKDGNHAASLFESGKAFRDSKALLVDNNYSSIAKLDETSHWFHDKSKLIILLAQMHKVANEHPDDLLEYRFYDDKDEIIKALGKYFTQYPHLVPKNLTLSLNCYMGKTDLRTRTDRNPQVEELFRIQGTGPIIKQYPKFVIDLSKQMIRELTGQGDNAINDKNAKIVSDLQIACSASEGCTEADFIKYFKPEMLANTNQNKTNSSSIASNIALASGVALLGSLIGVGIASALIATGVLAPLGVGILGVLAVVGIGAAIGYGASLLGFGIYKAISAAISGSSKSNEIAESSQEKTDIPEPVAPSSYQIMQVNGLANSSRISSIPHSQSTKHKAEDTIAERGESIEEPIIEEPIIEEPIIDEPAPTLPSFK